MASALSTLPSSSSFTCRRISSCGVWQNPKAQLLKWIPYSGLTPFSSWNGLKQLGISKSLQIVRSRKHRGKKGVYASLFGVGAPEALVIGVVALLVFGPKGLAEVARNLGKTLREFQPTIRELQDVSREFKSTLEREIGLDDIKGSGQDTIKPNTTNTKISPSLEVDPNGSPSSSIASSGEDDMEKLMRIAAAEKQAERDMASKHESQSGSQNESQADSSCSLDGAYSTEEYLKITEEQLEAAAMQQKETSAPEQSPSNAQSQKQADNSSSSEGAYSSEETSSSQESPSITQNQSQETPQEAASVIASSRKPESEI